MENRHANSERLFGEAVSYIPGGVNSPVRAFSSVGMSPLFIKKSEGPHIIDADGNRYIDYVCSWGPMILGHNNSEVYDAVVEAAKNGLSFGYATEIEVKMAKLICEMVPSVQMVRMVNSGTEAVMSAIRAARGFTGRNKILKFEGCYHGHTDSMLVKAGSGLMTSGIPTSAGVPQGCTQDTLLAAYNDLEGIEKIFQTSGDEIAAVIVEPVAANMGVVLPGKGFLERLRSLCDSNGAVLIFDEVITGFRLSAGGAGEYFGIRPDLITFGKIIGAGMPVGAYGGSREIMECISPSGPVYQAGTLSGNPIAMNAGYTLLSILKNHPEYYAGINHNAETLFEGMKQIIREAGLPYRVNYIGSLGNVFFTDTDVTEYGSASKSDTKMYAQFFRFMLSQGICLAPSQFEAMFVSYAHDDSIIRDTLNAFEKFIHSLK
ncbi:glutamate-1-semialdehyde 2,1-aminomutase [Parasporobacterium paucivorans]|uniref:Glutamate-1-semialdehyde 2,1-aminomutase n=1 Tax=Parasporobacterium paucivorans DSM 15970 TaxID=1122934 RepID=A0A1M6DT34_9FIRM|nr:glutamate-1-semialdehyde 2,1-aminomutase [Parasporobacterium paucivorans]SHI76299.1 glutamate-1-semialdehyde 2,1-aminomutase [Parasporobacterium paucivorans DSM 15970]